VIASNFINVRIATVPMVLAKMIAASCVVMGMCCAVKSIKTSPPKKDHLYAAVIATLGIALTIH
jgi:hypothetical protein